MTTRTYQDVKAKFPTLMEDALKRFDKGKGETWGSIYEDYQKRYPDPKQVGAAHPAPSADQAQLSELEQLRAENAKLKAAQAARGTISLKVSEKGGLSVYGLGRFPVTLYREQWERLLAATRAIEAFILDNSDRLTVKEPKA